MDNIILTQVPLETLLQSLRLIIKEEIKNDWLGLSTQPIEIIDTATLCSRLNITEPTVIRHRKRGKIPFLRIGSSIRYDWNAVVKALESKKRIT
jgi:excisionase family DNA binding protein